MTDFVKFQLDRLDDWASSANSRSKQTARFVVASLFLVGILYVSLLLVVFILVITASNYPAILIGLAVAVSVLVSLWLFKD